MEFNTLFFIFLFLPIFIFLIYIIKNNNIRNLIVLSFSLVFYIFGDYKHFIILILEIVLAYIFAKLCEKKKNYYFLYLLLTVAILSYYKYGNYLLISLNSFIKEPNLDKIIMPLGISFYTFTSISYVSDIYYEKYQAENNILNLATYISFFPAVISGPLIKYDNFKTFLEHKEINSDNIANGLRRFIIGLAKKVLIANQLALIASTIITDTTEYSFLLSWYAFIAYGMQEYYDFSGYSDMAISIGQMMGYTMPENFDNPYFSHSIAEYWRRWHMSLGTWFNDYVFVSIAFSKTLRNISKKFSNKKTGRTFVKIVSLLAVWMLTGIWHGAELNYFLWGLLNGLIIIADASFGNGYKKMREFFHIHPNSKLFKAFQILRTDLILFSMKSFFFKCANLNQVKSLFKGLIGLGSPFNYSYVVNLDVLYLIIYVVLGFILLFPSIKKKLLSISFKAGYIYDLALCGILFISIAYIVSGSYSAFLYFSF